ncbi:hypothetical protein EJ03DRAFT_328723 [Teratosphaeria nubilosa]|uniref:Snf7-domain-containing protein n=1 Tax=Teratosphaeria nubilosa TaxID=161662 RepID=A0A6G1L6X3_9PEZI|nr:hypothetical protein EJ03DRAFT_328723 [Teratosphaeria nubilosa]
MGNTSSAPKISARDRAILDMKLQRDKLKQYQKRIKSVTDRETAIARECIRQGDKPRALLALRRKKYQESLLQQSDRQLAQLQALTADVEFALVQKDVLFGLQQGTRVLNEIQREMGGVEGVELILGQSEEARAYQEEIAELLAGKMSNAEEDEVEDELQAMQREVRVGSAVPSMPEAPRNLVEGELPDAPHETPEEKERRRREQRAARFEARSNRQALAA